MLYPLTFEPIYKPHIWGGRRLEELYGRALPPQGLIGESWEISDRPEGVSVIANGPLAGKDLRWLMEHHAVELLGKARPLNNRFPLLVKILDCRQPPSVQVHPPEAEAARLGGEPKTELWYVTEAQPGARLHVGLRRGVKRGQVERKLGEAAMANCLHTVPVRPGDAMFVPSGRLHSIGGGVVLIEVQQNSNTTYRLYDWGRVGEDGKPRELQLSQALAATDFDDVEPDLVRSGFEGDAQAATRRLADTPWFGVEEWQARETQRRSLGALDRPIICAVVAGKVTVTASGHTVSLGPGQFCLVPASVADAVVVAEAGATCLLAAPGVEVEEETVVREAIAPTPSGVPPWRSRHAARGPSGPRRGSRATGERRSVLPSRREIKRTLSKRLIYSPFLKMMVLFFWFRLVVLTFVVIGLVAAIFLPRIWRATPEGFLPPVKISLLDKVQASMLNRSARKAVARGDYQAGLQGWKNSFGNNPGDPESARGLLQSISALEPIPPKEIPAGLQAGEWLLRLALTNRADLELVCTFLDKAQLYEMANAHLEPFAKGLTGNLKAIYVKSVFFEADFDQYNALWDELTPEEQAQPDMALIRAGYLAGWGKVDNIGDARQVLEKAAGERGSLWLLANRLQMAISSMQVDPDRYFESLKRLQEAQLDNGIDNATYWAILATGGRKSEAIRLAREFAVPPRSAGELVRLARVNLALGLTDEALKLMRAFANYFPASEGVWMTYATMLLDAKDWEGLRGAALQMRRVPAFRGRLDALGHFYEGRADLATARVEAARLAFDAATNADFRTPGQSILAATSLLGLGYPAHARAILERAESMVTNRLQYLELMSRAAVQSKDDALLLSTSLAAYELDPSNVNNVNLYAAALLIRAERPEEAIRLTMELHSRMPTSSTFQINHALALLLNRRPDEAASLLEKVAFSRLRPEELNSYYQAMFELKVQKQEYPDAWQMLDRIDWSQLFPSETNRLGQMRATLPPRPSSPSPPPAS